MPFVCWKRGKYYLKVDKNGTSQECSKCGANTGKKQLSQRVHNCQFCNHTESRDTNSAKIIMQRGLVAVGHTVKQKACGGDATGFKQLSLLFASWQPRKQESPVKLRQQLTARVSKIVLREVAHRECHEAGRKDINDKGRSVES